MAEPAKSYVQKLLGELAARFAIVSATSNNKKTIHIVLYLLRVFVSFKTVNTCAIPQNINILLNSYFGYDKCFERMFSLSA